MPSSILLTAALTLYAAAPAPTLRDLEGHERRFVVASQERLLVVAFLGVECPLAKLYAARLNELADEFAGRGVRFLGVDPNVHDTADELRAFARAHQLRFPLARDEEAAAVAYCEATRTPEVVVFDAAGRIRYRGRIDDQYAVGARRVSPTSHDLRDALAALLAGREPPQPRTEPAGCLIARKTTRPRPATITYAEHIAPLVAAKCAGCHAPGEVGPLSLLTYEDVRGHAPMIAEVVTEGRMPPWPASSVHGAFKNDPSLTPAEKRTLLAWIAAGCRSGDLTNIAAAPTAAATAQRGIDRPDAVIRLPHEVRIPATGLLDYQYFDVDPQFTSDRWLAAIEVRPSNRAVVHHCNVFLKPPGSPLGAVEAAEQGALGSVCLTAMAAGSETTAYPPGMAKRLPAGWRLLFVVHYATIGTPQTDRLELRLKFADESEVEREVATRLIVDERLAIPPHAADHRVEHTAAVERDLLLLALFPHLHLRGKSFRYDAEYPDGRRETLLDVPRWQFGWQPRYEFVEPKRLPAGTLIRCTAVYDNSSGNPANPDPSALVRTGPLSTDEMFNGYFDVAPAESEPPTATRPREVVRLSPVLALMGLLVWARRFRSPSAV